MSKELLKIDLPFLPSDFDVEEIDNPKATVFPDPVCADTSASFPIISSVKTASWIGVSVVYPRRSRLATNWGATGMEFFISGLSNLREFLNES